MKLRKVAVAIVGWVLLMSHAQPAGANDSWHAYQFYDVQQVPLGLYFYQTVGGLTHLNVVYAIGHMSFFGASASYPALQQGPARLEQRSHDELPN